MYDNITIFYKDAEIILNYFSANKAIKLLEKRIAEGEATAQNYAFLADAYTDKNNYTKALKYALKAKQIDADYYYTYKILIDIMLEEGKVSKAERYLNILLEKAPEDYLEANTSALAVYSHQNEFGCKQSLLRKYAEKIIEQPDDGSGCYAAYRSVAYYTEFGDLKNSFIWLTKAFYRSPLSMLTTSWLVFLLAITLETIVMKFKLNISFTLWTNICKCFAPKEERYFALTDPSYTDFSPQKAIQYLDKAININPKPIYRYRKAMYLYNLDEGYEPLIIQILQNILAEDSTFADCYRLISWCYMDLNENANALKYINLAILNNQNEEDYYYWKSSILKRLNKDEDALNVLLKYEEKHPDAPNIANYIANNYNKLEDFEKALLYINKALIKEKNYDRYCCKASILNSLERYEEAIKAGENANKICEGGLAYYWMAIAYGRLEKYSQGLICINKSILLDGGDKWSFKIQSELYSALGRYKDAEKAYNKARKLGLE